MSHIQIYEHEIYDIREQDKLVVFRLDKSVRKTLKEYERKSCDDSVIHRVINIFSVAQYILSHYNEVNEYAKLYYNDCIHKLRKIIRHVEDPTILFWALEYFTLLKRIKLQMCTFCGVVSIKHYSCLRCSKTIFEINLRKQLSTKGYDDGRTGKINPRMCPILISDVWNIISTFLRDTETLMMKMTCKYFYLFYPAFTRKQIFYSVIHATSKNYINIIKRTKEDAFKYHISKKLDKLRIVIVCNNSDTLDLYWKKFGVANCSKTTVPSAYKKAIECDALVSLEWLRTRNIGHVSKNIVEHACGYGSIEVVKHFLRYYVRLVRDVGLRAACRTGNFVNLDYLLSINIPADINTHIDAQKCLAKCEKKSCNKENLCEICDAYKKEFGDQYIDITRLDIEDSNRNESRTKVPFVALNESCVYAAIEGDQANMLMLLLGIGCPYDNVEMTQFALDYNSIRVLEYLYTHDLLDRSTHLTALPTNLEVLKWICSHNIDIDWDAYHNSQHLDIIEKKNMDEWLIQNGYEEYFPVEA